MKIEHIGSLIRTRLSNGLTVVLKENHHSPVVAIQVWVDVGSADEEKGEEGLAHLHEHMLFKGTDTQGVGEIAKSIEAAGGEINAWTSFDHTVYHVVLASRYMNLGLEVLADAVQNATFDPQELQKEKTVVLEEIKRNRDLPARWIGDLLFEEAFKMHTYRRPILGTKESVSAFDRKSIQRFFRRHYVPGRMTVILAGDFKPSAVLSKIRHLFGKVPASGRSGRRRRPVEPSQRKIRSRLIRDDIQEAHFSLGFHIPSVADKDIPALDILALLLGQGESSRLNLRLRHGLSLVNDVYTYAYTPLNPGLFLAGGSGRSEQVLEALRQLASEMALMSRKPVTTAELSKAKTMIESDSLYQQETVEGMARRIGYHQVLLGDPTYGDTYISRIMALTTGDIMHAAQTYLSAQNATVVALVPDKSPRSLNTNALGKAVQAGFKAPAVEKDGSKAEKDVTRVKLKNGPTLLIQEDHTNALVSVRAAYLGGVRFEDESSNGINHFLAGMFTRGTTTRTAEDIAREMDEIAGHIDGFSGRNTFGLRADFPSRFLDRGLGLFSDCLLHPTFPEKEIKRERELVLEAIRSRKDNLSGLAFDLFTSTLYASHPYRLPMLGTRQSVLRFKQPYLQDYLARTFSHDRMVISVVGDVDTRLIIEHMKTLFPTSTPRGKIKAPKLALDPRPARIKTAIRHRSRAQAHLVLGFMGTTISGRDRFPLEVLMAILAGQGGRLFVELRDRLSLAYAISGFSLEGIEPGFLAIYLGVDPDRLDEATAAVKKQLTLIVEKPISSKELHRAKQYLVGSQAISMQRISARSTALVLNELYGLGYLAHREYEAQILAITAKDVQRAAKKYIDLNAYCLAMIRPKPS